MSHHNGTPFPVTGNLKIDIAIAKLIKGTEDRLSVEWMISSAQMAGDLPTTDSDGRYWSPEDIVGYGLMITPRR